MENRLTRKMWSVLSLAIVLALVFAPLALASEVNVAVVDVTIPVESVTLAPGGSGAIVINMSVTGKQEGTATFEVYRDWTLSGGAFVGSNPQEFEVPARPEANASPTNFTTTGTVSVAAGQTNGTFTLEVGAFDITNEGTTAKLKAGESSNYQVIVETPSTPTDSTPPVITIITPADSATYKLGQVVEANYSCEDEDGGSGIASCVGTVANGAAIDTSSVGSKSFTVDAADIAGNKAKLTHNYSVVYDFDGFFAPLAPFPTRNVVKAGSAIPVKFSLAGYQGLEIILAGYPKSKTVDCNASDPSDPIESTVTAGESSLSYDAGQYNYVWKTDKGWAGTCRLFFLGLKDGTGHNFIVEFKK